MRVPFFNGRHLPIGGDLGGAVVRYEYLVVSERLCAIGTVVTEPLPAGRLPAGSD